jgi:hypothetical protein
MQRDLHQFIDKCFEFFGNKDEINLHEFTTINEEFSSEMLLSVIINAINII